jgi:hypothetical protein
MTECVVDSTSEPVDSLLETWGELLETLDFELESTNRVVTAVRFEGVDQPSYRADEVRGRALAGLAHVEVESAEAGELLRSTIMTARDSVAVLSTSAIDVADTYRGLNIKAAHIRFAELADTIRQLTLLTAAVSAAGVIDLGTLTCGTQSASQIIDGVGISLQRLLVWQEARDWVGAADCLEFDLAPALDRWSTVFDAIQRHATRVPNGVRR